MKKKYFIYFAILAVLAAVAFGGRSPAVEDFTFSCVYGGEQCLPVVDTTVGICRTLQFATPDGLIGVLLCHKDDLRYELYRQFYPGAKDFKVCTADDAGCIDSLRGFDSFTTQEFDFEPSPTDYCYKPIENFQVTCGAPGCHVTTDTTIGTCRSVVFASDLGPGQILACHKGDNRYEVYSQQGAYKRCLGPGCVEGAQGFDSFEITCPPLAG